ncbi:hypothetical protein [Amycolatopsis xylanica]|nr:hypothetical protein [Amycolatopsis xylanica]
MRKSVITRSAVAMTTGLVVLSIASGAGPAIVVGELPVAAAAANCAWTVRQLPKPSGTGDVLVQVTGADGHDGYAGFGDRSGVVTWSKGAMTVVGSPPGLSGATVTDMNGAGTIVGVALDEQARANRAYALKNGKFDLLPLPDGYSESHATAINARGDILGTVSDKATLRRVVWRSGVPSVLDIGDRYDAVDLDDDGTILLNHENGPALWVNGELRPLATPDGLHGARATAIRGGKVVGYALPPVEQTESTPVADAPMEGNAHALYWDGSSPVELPNGTTAVGINSSGLIIGSTGTGTGPSQRPAVWRHSEATVDQLAMGERDYGYVTAVGDDNTVAGQVNREPAAWQCR